ncbi:MAG TPA: D-aminoacyl-tRNA deacylase [Candidatus Cybelea sp.]|nr:D-aminoacyl-tRNA deacylase [Candidatus Cybelea sp.]
MRAVAQRVSSARVRVDGEIVGEINAGLLALVSVGLDDEERDARSLAEKIVDLRIFPDEADLMNRSLRDTGGGLLLVSQFTLHGDVRRGRRPSFVAAAREPLAKRLYELVGSTAASLNVPVEYGKFGAKMTVELVNEGPVTILIDTKRAF